MSAAPALSFQIVTTEEPSISTRAEQLLVGALLNDASALPKVCEVVNVGDFADDGCRVVFKAMLECAGERQSVDALTVSERLERTGRLAEAGGFEAVVTLQANTLPTNVESYARSVREHANERTIARVGERLAEAVRKTACPPSELARLAIQTLSPIAEQQVHGVSLAPEVDLSFWGESMPPPRPFVIPGMVPANAAGAWNGDGGVGKTRLALQMLVAVAAGVPFLGRMPETTGPVVLLSAEEDAASLRTILHEIAHGMGLSPDVIDRARENLHVIDLTGAGPALYHQSATTSRGAAVLRAAAARAPVLLVVDNASACFSAGTSGFDTAPVYAFYAALMRVVSPQAGSVLVLMHETKGAQRDGNRVHAYSGSGAWNNAARFRIAMFRDPQEKDVRIFRVEKGNYTADDHEGIRLVWRAGAWVSEGDGGMVGAIRTRVDAKAVVSILLKLLDAGQTISANAAANNNPAALAQKLNLMNGLSKHRFWEGLEKARADGWIALEIITKDRRDRPVYRVTDAGKAEACSHVLA